MRPHAKTLRPGKLPLHKLIPNMITLAAMAAGITSIKFAVAGKWEAAVIAIVAAAFMDATDGAAARLLKASSKLGAELDSLSDFVSFGVAPALLVYLWSLQDAGRWGWFIVLVYIMAMALRLARFNIMKEEAPPEGEQPCAPLDKYFTGTPAPANAMLCVLPLVLSFMLGEESAAAQASLLHAPVLTGAWMLIIAGLAVSHIPTFSSKQIRVPYRMKVPALAVFTLLVAGLINDPWPTLTLMGAAYLAALPFGVLHYRKTARALAEGRPAEDDAAED